MRSLGARLTIGVALVLAAVIAGFSVALYTASSRAAGATALARLTGVTDRLAAAVEWCGDRREGDRPRRDGNPPAEGNRSPSGRFKVEADMLAGLRGHSGIAFSIAAPDGKPLASWAPFDSALAKLGRPSLPATGWHFRSGHRDWQVLVSTRTVRVEDEAEGSSPAPVTLAVAVDVTEDREALHRLAALLGVLGPLVFLLGTAGVYGAVRRGLSPLRAMGEAAARVDERTLAERVPVPPTGDELARLGASLNAALARLEEAFARERAFIADASHELRTPVSILLTTLEVEQARPRSPEETAETMETLLQATRRLRGIVESMLTLARADAGRLPLQREPVDLDALLRQSVAQLGPLAAPRKIVLSLRSEAPVVVPGDAGLLRQLVDNLVANAIRYNRDGGRVEIACACARAEGKVTVSVSDTGIGIPAEHLARLFDRFYRVDKGRSREAGGAGLGLAIVKWIAEAHGGSVAVESEPGKGTSFRVVLPAGAFPGGGPDTGVSGAGSGARG